MSESIPCNEEPKQEIVKLVQQVEFQRSLAHTALLVFGYLSIVLGGFSFFAAFLNPAAIVLAFVLIFIALVMLALSEILDRLVLSELANGRRVE